MRITFVLPNVRISGGVKATLELANRLHSRGHIVSVVYPLIPGNAGRKWYDVRKQVARLFWTLKNLYYGNKIRWFDYVGILTRILYFNEKWIPYGDVIIVTCWENACFVNSCSLNKGKKIYFIRHYEIWAGPKNLVDYTYTLPLHKLVVSSWLKDIIKEKFNVSVLASITDGVDSSFFYREERASPSRKLLRIGMLYRKDKWKGMRDGLDAFLILEKKYKYIQFVLFGEIPSREDSRIIKKLQNLEFYKIPYKERLRNIYNSLDIFVFPSHCEGFGLPPMEAMACGVAVVSTSVGGVPGYAKHQETALLCKPGNVEELVVNIENLIIDDNKRMGIAKNGCQYIKQFTWDKSADKLECLLKEIIIK